MDTCHYLAEGYRQLRNQQYYRQLPGPIFNETGSKINAILAEMVTQQFITKQQYKFLSAKNSDRQRRFYLLPKIHKPRTKWTIPDVMPEGRPIVSNTGSESVRVAQYIDHFLRPLSIRHPAYIKDTYDFVAKIRGRELPPGALIVTADVSSLYTNMKLDRIMSTVATTLRRFPEPGRPDQHLLQLLDLTLRSNDFLFNGDVFLQTCGAAMGIPYAPALADIYLQDFDEAARSGFHLHPLLYHRYIDDIIFVWTNSAAELLAFQSFLNGLIPGIKVEFNYSDSAVQFLDTTVYATDSPHTGRHLETKVFFKETDTHQLLHKDSFHPRHTCNGVLKSQFIRFKRICRSKDDYEAACHTLVNALRSRNYSRSLMRKMKRDVWNDASLAAPRLANNNCILPIVIPHDELGKKLAQKWRSIISANNNFSHFRLITAYTVGDSLHRKLVSSLANKPTTDDDLTTNMATDPSQSTRAATNATEGCFRCQGKRCHCCQRIQVATHVVSHSNNNTYKIRGNINCKSTHLIYLIECLLCHKQYVGETSRQLSQRLSDHISCINTSKNSAIGVHFNTPGHSAKDLTITGLECTSKTTNTEYRRIREATWNALLGTCHPLGLNCTPSTRD